jgi:hypothetical protein
LLANPWVIWAYDRDPSLRKRSELQLQRTYAYLMRYGRQAISEIDRLTRDEAIWFQEGISDLLEAESKSSS